MHISVTGVLGSGKSTVCNVIVEKYGFEKFSTGMIMRRIAAERGIDVLEINKLAKTDPSIDKAIDEGTTKISRERKNDNLIFDSRMAWFFAENTFKVFITTKPEIAAKRVFSGEKRFGDGEFASVEEAYSKLCERSNEENERFFEFYGVRYNEKSNYNLIIDSSNRTPDEIAEIIMRDYELYRNDPDNFTRKEYN